MTQEVHFHPLSADHRQVLQAMTKELQVARNTADTFAMDAIALGHDDIVHLLNKDADLYHAQVMILIEVRHRLEFH